jgi:catechol 2,3-dioxygenase-like lactoylglutathione lyase family enzyme
MIHHAQSLAGIVLYSPDPARLTAFYREAIGVPLADADHGTVGGHQEGQLGGVHFAVWDERASHGAAPLVPVFRVTDLGPSGAAVERLGARRLHKPIDLGEGKRICGYADPDGRAFRLIQLG